jgi:enoyl-CoA hydratase/carnithine racemase
MHRMMRVSTLMTDLGAPVICKVNGLCVGGGAELMLFSDVVIAAEHAYFAFNGTDIGGCSWWGAPQLLPLMVGLRRAEEILYESRRVTAAEAERIGLITRCVAKDRLDAEVEERCQLILDLSAEGLRLTKAALRATRAQVLSTMTTAAETNAAAVAGPELHRAFDAFLAGERMDWRSLRPAANTNSKSDSEKNSDKEQEA